MKRYQVKPGSKIKLSEWDPNEKGDFEGGKEEGRAEVLEVERKAGSTYRNCYMPNTSIKY